MPKIKPISDLQNYSTVLDEITVGEPVFLTKDGRGRYVIIDIQEYEKTQATLMLFSKLSEAEETIKNGEEWLEISEVEKKLGV